MGRASWGTMAIRSRIRSGSDITSIPLSVVVPAVDSRLVARMRTRVVFPEPFRPMSTNTPRVGRVKLTESRAGTGLSS